MMPKDYELKSFWLATAGDYKESPPLDGDTQVDVAVVGGGFCGISSAYYLKRANPNLRVAVLEDRVTGFGASGRNAGFAMTPMGLHPRGHRPPLRREGPPGQEFGHRAVDHRPTRRHPRPRLRLRKPGSSLVATNPPRPSASRRRSPSARARVEGLRWLEADEMRSQVDSHLRRRRWEAVRLINPAKFVRGMKDVAVAGGVEVYERTPVLEFKAGKKSLKLQTPGGTVKAEKAVFATNAFSTRFPKLYGKQFPVYTYIILTEPLSDARLGSIGWKKRQGIGGRPQFILLPPDGR
jgi:glycine/D-amino acid oxidase-like deaminating enzyme